MATTTTTTTDRRTTVNPHRLEPVVSHAADAAALDALCAEAIADVLPDLTLISLDDAAALRQWVNS